jgi:4-alpha-glucanotransferase
VRALSADDGEVAFQLYVQWRADQGLARAQQAAKDAGMAVGLITDMAVGMDPAGSHAWSAPDEVLQGLTIGAPPDLFNANGQNWGLTNFSPLALHRTGFDGIIATLRSAMRHAGGIRLDHAMGLERVWVIPQGASAADGIYLHYPRDELLALLARESRQHRALVVAEDLGTVPKGFRGKISRAGLLGMRVLWFERDRKGAFIAPGKWGRHGAALSTTHDLPTLAGWWSGRDIEWHAKLGAGRAALARERKARAKDRHRLWQTLRTAGATEATTPPANAPGHFVDAAFRGLAATQCPLKLLPVEDFIGEREQPNVPGTIDEHPNWRRRLKNDHPLDDPAARRRAKSLGKTRS